MLKILRDNKPHKGTKIATTIQIVQNVLELLAMVLVHEL
jgi:hypothetical protein